MNERSGAREQSEEYGASELVSGASERANGRASGRVLQSVFLVVLAQSGERERDPTLLGSQVSGLGALLSSHVFARL